MNEASIYDIAVFCHNRFKETILENLIDDIEACFMPLYCAIIEDDTILCSKTPHILKNSAIKQCLIIHEYGTRKKNYNYKWNVWPSLEFIDSDGSVHGGLIDGGLNKDVSMGRDFFIKMKTPRNHEYELTLLYSDNELYLYGCDSSWENTASKVLKLYCLLKKASSLEEMKLAVELYKNDDDSLQLNEDIKDFGIAHQLLKKERDQYKELLDQIKELCQKK